MLARKKQDTVASVVTNGPCASRVGSNATRVMATSPAAVPNISLPARNVSSASKRTKGITHMRARKMIVFAE